MDSVFVLDYKQVLSLYEYFNDSTPVFYSMQIFKAFLCLFGFFKAIQITISAGGGDFRTITEKWQLKEWLKFLWVPALLGSYDFLIEFLDKLGLLLDTYYVETAMKSYAMKYRPDITAVDAQTSTSAEDRMSEMASAIIQLITDPSMFLLSIIEWIAHFLDWCVFGVILLERFFLLWILKIFGGFAIAGIILDETKEWFIKWLKVYMGYFLLIIPYVFINYFCNMIYMKSMTDIQGANGYYYAGSGLYGSMILIFLVVLKFKLFKSTSELVKSIFIN